MGGLLVRNVPHDVREWIEKERERNQMSPQEFVLSVLPRASAAETTPLLPFNDPPTEPAVPDSLPFKFVDLFAGIGGFRSALTKLGGECVFSCEWDRYCQKTYKAWWGETPKGNIRDITPSEIPDHDFLAAGFPCPPLSIAWVGKKQNLRQAHGLGHSGHLSVPTHERVRRIKCPPADPRFPLYLIHEFPDRATAEIIRRIGSGLDRIEFVVTVIVHIEPVIPS